MVIFFSSFLFLTCALVGPVDRSRPQTHIRQCRILEAARACAMAQFYSNQPKLPTKKESELFFFSTFLFLLSLCRSKHAETSSLSAASTCLPKCTLLPPLQRNQSNSSFFLFFFSLNLHNFGFQISVHFVSVGCVENNLVPVIGELRMLPHKAQTVGSHSVIAARKQRERNAAAS